MKIDSIDVYLVQIPFAQSIDHHLKRRKASESIIIKLKTDRGIIGYGEGAPRNYVTGEKTDEVLMTSKSILEREPIPVINSVQDIQTYCNLLLTRYKLPAMTCAMELALFDCLGQTQGCNISEYFSPVVTYPLEYSAILPFVSFDKMETWLHLIKQYEFRSLKVKVGTSKDLEVLRKVRDCLGWEIDVRLDANRAWSYKEAVSRIQDLERFDISCVEEPLSSEYIQYLPQLSEQINTPLMLDESVYNIAHAKYYADCMDADKLLFNIKISKSGGLLKASKIFRYAQKHGIECQLGCNVGETNVLSAAGRIFARTHRLRYLEGSYGSFFMKDDIGTIPLNFSQKGWAVPLCDPGLGIEINENKLKQYSNLLKTQQIN